MIKKPSNKKIVGWREWVDLPDWGVTRLRAKIDTGARTSALHVENLEESPDGQLSFDVVLEMGENPRTVRVHSEDLVRVSKVRPSSGIRQRRHVVQTRLVIGDVEQMVEISLVDRGPMLCRMLVGRKALGTAFLVNPRTSYILSARSAKTKKPRKNPPGSNS